MIGIAINMSSVTASKAAIIAHLRPCMSSARIPISRHGEADLSTAL